MAWYDGAVFYQIHPLSLCGCEHEDVEVKGSHFDELAGWAEHAKKMGCSAVLLGPLFKADMHGHGIVDYYKIDSRLGTNEDFKGWVEKCHQIGLRVVVDAVFNHVGRGFFAFQHLRRGGKKSAYKEWFSNLNFYGDNEYGDGFRYESWGGYDRLVKLNVLSPWLLDYHFDTVRHWISEFDIDGLRIGAIEELEYDFIKELRKVAEKLKPDFWLLGELADGAYARWVNDRMLHSAENSELQKELVWAHNSGSYPRIAHLLRNVQEQGPYVKLFTFVDNHDVSHVSEHLNKAEHRLLITLLQYTVYGIPSLYCGSEFSVTKARWKDAEEGAAPVMDLADYKNAYMQDEITHLHCLLGRAKQQFPELIFGRYQELMHSEKQFVFARVLRKNAIIVAVNNDDSLLRLEIPLPVLAKKAVNLLDARIVWEKEAKAGLDTSGCAQVQIVDHYLLLDLPANGGRMVWVTG